MRGDETLTKAIDLIVTKLGKGAIMALGGEVGERLSFETISTGSLHLDRALGIGPESSGKTTLTLHVIAEAQRSGMVCAFIDAEHALDVGYARAVGVQPDHGEQALEIVDTLSLGICSPR